MEGKQQQQHKKIRTALKDKEKETEAIKERINEMNGKHQKNRNSPINKEALRTLKNRLGKIEKKQHDQNHQLRSALDQEEKHLSLVKESFKQITNLQQQKHTSIRSELHEEEERLRSSNVNSSTFFQTMMRPVTWVFCCSTTNSNVTGNQNPSNEIEYDQEDQHHKTRSALEHEKKNLDSLQTSIEQIEEIQRQEEHQLTSALQPDEKQSQLQREDIKTADMVSLQKRFQILENFRLNIRSSVKEEKWKLLVKRLDQIKNLFQRPHEEVRASLEEKETYPLLQRSSWKERETEDFKQRSKLKEQQREIEALQQRLSYEEMQHQNRRSALKEKDMKIKDLQERIEDMKNNEQKQHHLRSSHKEKEKEIEDLKRTIEEKDEQIKLIRIQEKEVAQQKHKLRSLKDKEKETEALKQIINEKDEQLQRTKSASKEKQMETESLLQRVQELEAQLQKSRSALTKKEDEYEKLNQSSQAFYQQQNHNARSLKDKEKETEALKRTISEKDKQLQLAKSGKQTEIEPLLQRVHEMEAQLQISRSALREKDEQLKSFKDRVAGEVALSIKTGNTMSLNNPVNKNRLKEMYEDLRCDWPKIKKNLKSNNKHPDSVKELILKEFREAKIEMRNRRMMIDKVFEKVNNAGETPQKVDQYRQLTVQNLQMTLYSEKQEAGSQKPVLENEAGNPQDVLEYLGSECYWLGCLMALNNPPLQPDWENHPPSMDRWDLFPRNIRTASENE